MFPPKNGALNSCPMAIKLNSIPFGFRQQVPTEEQCLFPTTSSLISVPLLLKHDIQVGEVCFLCHMFNQDVSCESDIPKLYHVVFSDNFRTVRILGNDLEDSFRWTFHIVMINDQ